MREEKEKKKGKNSNGETSEEREEVVSGSVYSTKSKDLKPEVPSTLGESDVVWDVPEYYVSQRPLTRSRTVRCRLWDRGTGERNSRPSLVPLSMTVERDTVHDSDPGSGGEGRVEV